MLHRSCLAERDEHSDAQGAQKAATERLVLDDAATMVALLGTAYANLKAVERETGVVARVRGNEVTLTGEAAAVALARALLEQLYALARRGGALGDADVVRAARALAADRHADLRTIFGEPVLVTGRARPITPKGAAQKRYVDAIRSHDIVFGIGPAGTGKTYLAMALAVRALVDKQVKRIILTRPAVEAGERLGFLPGSMEEKVNPYLRPLYDALHDMLDFDRVEALMTKGAIEVAPLAFMRGRTLSDSFVILDEAQNTTCEQMKMFLTRLGWGSKAVVTGDVTQVDLPTSAKSGLIEAREVLAGINGIRFCYFTDVDVVRHPLVQEVVRAYERRGGTRHIASPTADPDPAAR